VGEFPPPPSTVNRPTGRLPFVDRWTAQGCDDAAERTVIDRAVSAPLIQPPSIHSSYQRPDRLAAPRLRHCRQMIEETMR
jgi:hypothetical protein